MTATTPCEPPFVLLDGQWPSQPRNEYEIMNVCQCPGLVGHFSSEEDFITAPFAQIIPVLDVFLEYQGLLLLKSEAHCGWKEMVPALAEAVLTHMISTGMIYSFKRSEVEKAKCKAKVFVNNFNQKVRYFTPADLFELELEKDGLPPEHWREFYTAGGYINGSGGCLTHWTFGTGVIAVDTEKVGVYWIQDED